MLDLDFSDAVLLNNIVQNFGMLDLVKKVLASHKSQMDRYREQYSRSLVGELNAHNNILHYCVFESLFCVFMGFSRQSLHSFL